MTKQILWKHICWNIICFQSIDPESQCSGAELYSQKNAIFETTQQDFRKLFMDLPSKFYGNIFPFELLSVVKVLGLNVNVLELNYVHQECNIETI